MDLQEKSRKELLEIAKKLELQVAKNIDTEVLRTKVEFAAIERHEKVTAEVRERLNNESKLKQRLAEVKASATLAGITLKIPKNPTIMDVVRLEKELGIKKKIPKPSPETLAIKASKKVYAIFKEPDDVDIVACVGGKYRFHFWPEKVHVLPEWLINHYRSKKNPAGTRPQSKFKEVHGHAKIAMRMTPTERRSRFTFEIIGDAPKDAKFGIVTDEAILSELEQPV